MQTTDDQENLRRRLEEMEKQMTEEDWASFQHQENLPPLISDKMLSAIDRAVLPRNTGSIVRWTAAAAVILLLSIGAWMWTKPGRHSNSPIAAGQPARQHLWTEKTNRTGKAILFTMPDSSTVELADQSSIRYEDPFARKLYLNGRGLFAVKANITRPFTVCTKSLTTTALGTVFSVSSANDTISATEVRLISGKIVVRPDSLLRSKGIKETFLDPGQELKFDPRKLTVLVQAVSPPASSHAPAMDKIMTFDNSPLKDIFRTLGKIYHCRIVYNHSDIDDIRFTGSFNTSKESLPDFLNTISLLNNLTLTEKNNSFYLK
jgi:ferric-dicitrate binding protein FerR (iron transport regulator)